MPRPAIVTDLLLTDAFLIKGSVDNKTKRLSDHLDQYRQNFISVREATLIDLRSRNEIRTPRILVNMERVVLAHEFLDAGDFYLKKLSEAESRALISIRAFHVGSVNFEIAGEVRPGSYEINDKNRRFFVVEEPKIRGIDLQGDDDPLAILARLKYLIVAKQRLSYIYDFNG
ncbi:MAG: hypothetical protein HY286_11760 [Planctomycetes bacterium]|nr:hypothetical protein [Planctomycetota bacterium]